ncbi:MAG: cation:proton antiporter [Deltaproteobacteria bacterium]|nr:cation:proton antiporter [Deltaproteobacteria bacterium]
MRPLLLLLAAFVPSTALAVQGDAHADPVAPVALALVIVLLAAKLGSELAVRIGQPAVMGELVAGVVVGNLSLLGYSGLDPLWASPSLDMLARLGVLVLLFEVGLESTVGQMLTVGAPSLVVATLGVLTPFGLGWAASAWLLPAQSVYVHAFVGATLCATSVGITARVFQDLGRLATAEARIILGAAVIDDVMGLVVLAVVSGAIATAGSGAAFSYGAIALIVLKAALFLAGSLVIGVFLSPKLFHFASRLQARGVLLALGLAWCFLLSWMANLIGLAPIVGAFAAGLILEDVHYRGFVDRGEHTLEELIKPISAFLAPVFFVLMGMRTDLRAFAAPGVLGLSMVLTVAAVIGKQACSFGVWRPGIDRLTVGIGMIPRGEVGLIFANIGLGLQLQGRPVIDRPTFSALVVMVILTTLITPFALKASLGRKKRS